MATLGTSQAFPRKPFLVQEDIWILIECGSFCEKSWGQIIEDICTLGLQRAKKQMLLS